ncbi:MAG: ATP-binding protein, partial [Firmicutes bacterium]|nr:ATP-binding protein [Bacillota bacterium]
NIELKMRAKSGELISGLLSGDLVESQGKKYFITVMIDISLRKKAEEAIEYQIKFQKLITELSSEFVSANIYNISRKLRQMLKKIGQFFDMDLAYIFEWKKKESFFIKTHDWMSINATLDSTVVNKEEIKLPMEKMKWWKRQILSNDYVFIQDMDELPAEAKKERKILNAPDSKSILMVPIASYDDLKGFFGFESLKEKKVWSSYQLDLLLILANTLADAYSKVEAEEELILQKESAENANKTKSEFLANMSHEIRTPLNAIVGFADVLLEKEMEPENREFIRIIKSSGKHLLEIINNILDLSRIEAGKMEIDKSPFNLSKMLKEVISFIQPAVVSKGLKLKVLVDANIPYNLIGDYRQIKQIILNLISNAEKFTQKGCITVTISESETLKPTESFFPFQISVSDTGIGIPQQKLNSIFEPFDRGISSVERNFQGTGLGLTITKQLTEMMNGKITVESEENKGTTFHVHLPLELDLNASEDEISCDFDAVRELREERAADEAAREAAQMAESSASPVTPAAKKLLLVEDNEINQKLVKTFLKNQDYLIDCADNGAEGIIKAFSKDYDILLMDIQMPVMSGDKAIKVMRTNPLYRKKPILALTAHAMKGDEEKALAQGFSGYIVKPMVKNLLITTVSEKLKHEGSSMPDLSRRVIDKDILELIPDYIGSIEDNLKNIKTFMESDNLTETGKIAHKIKGSGACFGLRELSVIGEELEKAALTYNLNTAKILVETLEKVLASIKVEFADVLTGE